MSEVKTTPVSPARPAVDLSEESDYDLLEMMNWKESDPDVAREAWAEFYRRHIRYLYFVCLRHTRGLAGGWAAEDLAEDTIKRASHVGDTKAEVEAKARAQAKAERAELVIHGRDGKIQDSDSFGNDPCPPKDRKH